MGVLDPLQDSAKWLLDAGFRFSLRRLSKLPLAIAGSIEAMRVVTLTGMAVLSLGLLFGMVYVVRVNDAVTQTDDLSKNTEINIRFRLVNVVKVAEAMEWLIRNQRLSDTPERNAEAVRTLPWIATSEISGMALVSDEGVIPLYGSLDPSNKSDQWDKIRWSQIQNKTAVELREARESVTVFLGLERVFRTQQEFTQGAQLTGSILVGRAWKGSDSSWQGLVILLPVQSFNDHLRLGTDQYERGDYDYLVDSDGFVLSHPKPSVVNGTDADGRELRGASNFNEAGRLPINTRDSDWIAGSDTLAKAFGAMINHNPNTVVYKNLQNQPRLTHFRLVELDGFKGKSFGVVTGRGLSWFEATTIPFLLKTTSAHFLWATAGVYVVLLSGWLAFVSKFRSLHMDLLAWSRFLSAETANRLGLLPIPTGTLKEYFVPNIVTIVLSVDSKNASKKRRSETLVHLANLCLKLQSDGWIAQVWNSRQVLASRPLTDELGSKTYSWSPTNVTDYVSELDEFKSVTSNGNSSAQFRVVVWVIGDLQIKAGRIDSARAATIFISGDCIVEALNSAEELRSAEPSYDLVLMYPVKAAEDAGLKIMGERVSVNDRAFGKLDLAARNT